METIHTDNTHHPPSHTIIYKNNNLRNIDIYTNILKIHVYNYKELENIKYFDWLRYLYIDSELMEELETIIKENLNNYTILNSVTAYLFNLHIKQMAICENRNDKDTIQFILNHKGVNNIKITPLTLRRWE